LWKNVRVTSARIPKLKKWGQHFLSDAGIARRIVAEALIEPEESVLEVGPGDGALTSLLAESPGRVAAVEIDPRRAARLAARYPNGGRVTILTGDFLSRSPGEWLAQAGLPPPAVLVGNLPYNAATPILSASIEHRREVSRIIATVQREVARRIVARPGDDAYGYLSVRAALFCRARILFDIPAGAFRPTPKVVSSVVRLVPREPPAEGEELAFLLRVVSLSFQSRRKTLANALSAAGGRELWQIALREIGRPETARGEELSAEDFLALVRAASGRDG
jgi:16S rRNA (adenine1518-N6/adenine1519-N6)-dimethyltransferase